MCKSAKQVCYNSKTKKSWLFLKTSNKTNGQFIMNNHLFCCCQGAIKPRFCVSGCFTAGYVASSAASFQSPWWSGPSWRCRTEVNQVRRARSTDFLGMDQKKQAWVEWKLDKVHIWYTWNIIANHIIYMYMYINVVLTAECLPRCACCLCPDLKTFGGQRTLSKAPTGPLDPNLLDTHFSYRKRGFMANHDLSKCAEYVVYVISWFMIFLVCVHVTIPLGGEVPIPSEDLLINDDYSLSIFFISCQGWGWASNKTRPLCPK